MDSLCSNLSLKSHLVSRNAEVALYSFSKCPVLSHELESSSNFAKIKADLHLFAQRADIDEYYDFMMTSDINIFELKELCQKLQLKYESLPGNFIVQIDKEDDIDQSSLRDTVAPSHKISDEPSKFFEFDINDERLQNKASETPEEKSEPPISTNDTFFEKDEKNPRNNEKKLDDTSEETNFQMNDLLGSLARERNSRAKAVQQQQRLSKMNPKSKGKNKGKKSTKKAVKDEETHDFDDMAYLDSQIDKVMNSHGRTIDGKGKNFRTIINGNLLPKPKTKETKARDPRQADALARKLKEAKIARSAKPKKK
jgi:hypothetical protein